MKFNDIIRIAMKSTGTTQQDLGAKLCIRQNAIANTVARPGITLTKFTAVMNALGYEVIVRKDGEEMTLTNEDD